MLKTCTKLVSHAYNNSLHCFQVLTAKLLFSNVNETNMNSSDNSTDSSEGSPTGGGGGGGGHFDGPNPDIERLLPSAVSHSYILDNYVGAMDSSVSCFSVSYVGCFYV